DLSVGLKRVDDSQLLFRHYTRENVDGPDPLLQLIVGHPFQLSAGDEFIAWSESDLGGDALRCDRVVSRDHDDPDSCAITRLDSVWDCGSDGISQTHET